MSRRKNFEKVQKRKNLIMSILLAFVMASSILGFALMYSFDDDFNGNENQNIALQEFFDEQSGVTFWGARLNSEEIIFTNISGFNENIKLLNLSNNIKKQKSIDIYVDKEFLIQ